MRLGTLIKLNHHKDAHTPLNQAAVGVNQIIDGGWTCEPVPGHMFAMYAISPDYEGERTMYFRSSIVESVCVIGDGEKDKLVLPERFPGLLELKFPPDLKDGDILFSTLNSLYLLRPDKIG